MRLGGVCLTTRDAPRLAAFYQILLRKEPLIEGEHYGFGNIAVWNPGDVPDAPEKTTWLQCFDPDIDALHSRLLREIPGVDILSPPEKKPWGAYSFWLRDPDGNRIAVAQREEAE